MRIVYNLQKSLKAMTGKGKGSAEGKPQKTGVMFAEG